LITFDAPRAPKANFMPRIGLAWSPEANTSVRVGFGMGYDVLYDNIGTLEKPPQFSGTIDQTAPPDIMNYLANGGILPSPGGLRTFATLALQRAATTNHLTVDQKDPAAVQWTTSVQHSFGSKYTVEVRYLGTHGYHLNVQEHPNKMPRVDSTHFLPTLAANPGMAALDALGMQNTLATLVARPVTVPAYAAAGFNSTITEFSPDGNSIYHGLSFEGTRRFSNGLQFTANYTWSRNIDDSTADFNTTVLTPRRPQDFKNLHGDRSVSALSRTNRIIFAAYYDLPYFKTGNWMRRNLMGNWLFAPVYTYQSPEWADVQSGTDSNLNGDTAGDRVLVNPAGVGNTGSDITALKDTAGDTVAYLISKPTAKYIKAGNGALFANNGLVVAGRNTLPTRPINNFDLTAGKKFNITEGMRVEFQAQFSNLLNHPQSLPGFINRVDSVGFPAGGAPGATAFVQAKNANFGKAGPEFSSNSRIIQLVFKFVF
jgi:hypothetical protein